MRRLIAIGFIILIIDWHFSSGAAASSTSGGCSVGSFGATVVCEGSSLLDSPPAIGGISQPNAGQGLRSTAPQPKSNSRSTTNPSDLNVVGPIKILQPTPSGGLCLTTTTNPAATTSAQLAYLNLTIKNLGVTYPDCPAPAAAPAAAATPGPAPAPAPAVTPQQLAAQFWDTIPLPVPHPSIPPGYAITGKPAYLVTHGTVAPPSYATTTILGPLSVTAHGSYTVHWGDGATSGPYNTEGLPYPNGNISHTYDDVGTVTVTVDEAWTATWTLAGAGGTLTQLQTEATVPDLAIRQIQAVITS